VKTKAPHIPALTRTFAGIERCQQHRGELLTREGTCPRCDAVERLLSKCIPEPNSGCWLWDGARGNRCGYGQIWLGGRLEKAHRASYQLFIGQIGDMHVCHRCDVRACVNPDHLFLGTRSDNMRDMVSKGRNRSTAGEDSHISKLTNDIVYAMRARYDMGGVSQRKLAAEFGYSKSVVGAVVSRTRWTHLPEKTEAAA